MRPAWTAPHRARVPRVLVAVAVLVIGLGLLPAGGAAGQPTPPGSGPTTSTTTPGPAGPTPGPTTPGAPAARERARLELVEQTAFVPPVGTLTMKLAIADPPSDAILSFDIMRALTSQNDARNKLDSSVTGKSGERLLGLGGGYPAGVPVSFLATENGESTINLDFVTGDEPAPQLGFQLDDAGVYPIVVTLSAGEPRAVLGTFTTYLVRLPSVRNGLPPLHVAGVLPFRAPLALQTDGRLEMSDESIGRLRTLATVTRSQPSVPLTISPDAETIDSLGRLPAERTGGLSPADLSSAWKGRELLSSTYVPLDIDAWVASDLGPELSRQFRLGRDTVTDRLSPTPQPNTRTWLLEPTLQPASLTHLHTQERRDQLVMPADSVEPIDTGQFAPDAAQVVANEPFEVEAGDGGRYRAITTDQRLRDRFTAGGNPALNAQIAIADLAVLWFGADRPLPANAAAPLDKPRGIAVVLPEDVLGLASVDAFLQALAQPVAEGGAGGGRPIVTPSTLDQLFALEPATAPRSTTPLVRAYRPRPEGERRTMGDYLSRLAAARISVTGYRSMVQDTAPARVEPLDRLLDVSGAAQLSPPQRQAYLDAATAEVTTAADGIRPLRQERITLAATEAELRVQLENTNDYPVAVRVALTSDKLEFPTGNNFVTTLQPGVNKVAVKVRTRTSGEFPIAVRLASPDQNISLASESFSVVSTVLSAIGLALTIGAGLFLAVWWGRNFRKSRRAVKLVPPDATGSAAPA